MNITKTLYVTNRKQWRTWPAKHHRSAPEAWLVYYKKHSGKARIPYNDAVEEALCYRWIDASRRRPEFFKMRLQYFLKMTARNKRFGMVQ